MKKLFTVLLVSVCSIGAFARECELGSFVVYSASCSSSTASVYVRGDKENSVLEFHSSKRELDGTVKCYFSGNYNLTIVEKLNSRKEYQLSGCN